MRKGNLPYVYVFLFLLDVYRLVKIMSYVVLPIKYSTLNFEFNILIQLTMP